MQATETKTEEQIILDFSLSRITFLTNIEKQKLFDEVKSAENLSLLSVNEIAALIQRDLSGRIVWNGKENLKLAEREYSLCKTMDIGFLHYNSALYPAMLKTISNPPYMLFYRGSLEAFSQKSVSVVGSRQVSPEGKAAATRFACEASKAGVAVISGLANGVDGFAHKGACNAYFEAMDTEAGVAALGKTVAVLPSSIDQIVPTGHKTLALNILKSGGCIISEYAPMIELANWHFVKRNRLIAALSPATVVVEAPNGSGSLITADFALELGRDLMFHESCFSENARKINETVLQNLKNQYNKKNSINKTGVSAMQFVQDGAPVIKDYADYCRALAESPGTRNYIRSADNNIQLELDLGIV